MGRRNFLGISTVASLWREVYNKANVGTKISTIIAECGDPDEVTDLKDKKVYTWINEEWKGLLRGGTITRKMTYIVKEGIVIFKTEQNLSTIGW